MNTEDLLNRINTTLTLISEGHTINVGDLAFACKDEAHFSVIGSTNNTLLENITQQTALGELGEIKSLFSKMVEVSNQLSSFVKTRKIEYYLFYEYGMGAIEICCEKDGQIEWKTNLKA